MTYLFTVKEEYTPPKKKIIIEGLEGIVRPREGDIVDDKYIPLKKKIIIEGIEGLIAKKAEIK